MQLTREQAIEVQNWRCAGGAMCSDNKPRGPWSQTLILDDGTIVYVCGVSSAITNVFMSNGTGIWPMSNVDFIALDRQYSKIGRKRAPFA